MHIEPGIVDGTKIILSYATAATSLAILGKSSFDLIKNNGLAAWLIRGLMTSVLVFAFFEVLPHRSVGISEVHFILGTTLLLLFGAAPAAMGLTLGLLCQGLFFAPSDLPQLGMNLTTLLVPLFAIDALAKRIIPENTAYVDLKYSQALKLSAAYQGGVIAWVGFWAFYGQGFTAANFSAVGSFALAYSSVILLEPLVDLAVLASAKALNQFKESSVFHKRLYQAAN